MDTITVTVTRIPGTPKQVVLEEGSTAAQAIAAADIAFDADEIRVNRREAAPDDVLQDGDRVLVLKRIRGN